MRFSVPYSIPYFNDLFFYTSYINFISHHHSLFPSVYIYICRMSICIYLIIFLALCVEIYKSFHVYQRFNISTSYKRRSISFLEIKESVLVYIILYDFFLFLLNIWFFRILSKLYWHYKFDSNTILTKTKLSFYYIISIEDSQEVIMLVFASQKYGSLIFLQLQWWSRKNLICLSLCIRLMQSEKTNSLLKKVRKKLSHDRLSTYFYVITQHEFYLYDPKQYSIWCWSIFFLSSIPLNRMSAQSNSLQCLGGVVRSKNRRIGYKWKQLKNQLLCGSCRMGTQQLYYPGREFKHALLVPWCCIKSRSWIFII